MRFDGRSFRLIIAFAIFVSQFGTAVAFDSEQQRNNQTRRDENEQQFASSMSARQTQGSDINRAASETSDISAPDISWSGFRLNMDYIVSTSISDSSLAYGVYSDRECTKAISDSGALDVGLLTDPTLSDEEKSTVVEGTRMVQLTLLMNPTEIGDERYTSFSNGNAVVSLCIRLSVDGSTDTGSEQENFLSLEVDLDGAGGILALIPDQSIDWGVDVFRCNTASEVIANPTPVTQGERLRICLAPNQVTRKDGVYLSSINSFTFERGGAVQNAVTDGQISGDNGLTEIFCNPGSELCSIDTELYNEFFSSPGEVQGTGRVFLQYGVLQNGQRYLRRKVVEFEWPTNAEMRNLFDVGEFVGEKSVSYNLEVDPSSKTFSAQAFQCNYQNEPLTDSNAVFYGESVRICIQPDEGARTAGVFIRRIESFSFQRDSGEPQVAIDNAGEVGEDGNTLVICSTGEELCSIKTELAKWFFLSDGSVTVTGAVVLQYGTQIQNRRAQIMNRGLQQNDGSGEDSDPGFAGRSEVRANFTVAFSSAATKNPRDWWNSTPAYLKALYALAIAFCSLIVLCCIFGVIYFIYQRRKQDQVVMTEIYALTVKEVDDSVDARIDSKASFYSDLEFDTDAEENSSDEESISEHFEDDLEEKVAILFPPNPDPENLSHTLVLSSTDVNGRSLSTPHQLIDATSARDVSVHQNPTTPFIAMQDSTVPQRSLSLPLSQQPIACEKSKSDHEMIKGRTRALSVPPRKQEGAPGGQDVFSHSLLQNPYDPKDTQRTPSLSAKAPQRRQSLQGKQRSNDPLSFSKHGTSDLTASRRRSGQHRSGKGGLSQSEHGATAKTPLPAQEQPLMLGQQHQVNKSLSQSEHGTRGGQRRPAPKGRKTMLNKPNQNGDDDHPDGLTRVPRIEKAKNTPTKHSPFVKANHPSKKKRKNQNEPTDPSITASHQKASAFLSSKKEPGKGSIEVANGGQAIKKKKTSASAAMKNPATDVKSNGKEVDEGKGKTSLVRPSNKDEAPKIGSVDATDGASTAIGDSSDEGADRPSEDDICFEAEGHPGTGAFLDAVRKTLKIYGPSAYSPKVYRQIKRELPGRRFFVCDDDRKPYDWREVNKRELIDLVWKYYEDIKSQTYGVRIEEESDDGNSVESSIH